MGARSTNHYYDNSSLRATNNLFQSTRLLDKSNNPGRYEKDTPEYIRMKNVKRLQLLQEAAYDSFTRNSDEEIDFKNIMQPKSLDEFDSKLSKLLTPEPSRHKAIDLMNVGSSVISSNNNFYGFKKPMDSRLDRIEENYQELAAYDDTISYDGRPSRVILLP